MKEPQATFRDGIAAMGAVVAKLTDTVLYQFVRAAANAAALMGLVEVIQQFLASLIWVTPIGDKQVPERLQEKVAAWRRRAKAKGYDGPICWLIEPGRWLRQHVPLLGKCLENWGYMVGWKFKNDEPTKRWLVFWIPVFEKESTDKSVEDQFAWMADVRKRDGLPENHLTSFGPGVVVAGIMLAHKTRSGEEVPSREYIVRTDTFLEDGGRFDLQFYPKGLHGDRWHWNGVAGPHFCCLLLGVEELEPSDTLN